MCNSVGIDKSKVRQKTTEFIHSYEKCERQEVISAIQDVLHTELFDLNAGSKECCCPYCGSKTYIKYGTRNGKQRFQCKGCERTFTFSERGDVLRYTKLDESKWMEFAECFVYGYTCDETAEKIHVSHKTAWFMRIRTIEALYKHLPSFNVKDGTTLFIDGIYFRESFKGVSLKRFGNKIPRLARTGGNGEHTSGISDDQICVITGINDGDEMFYEVACRGALTCDLCRESLENVISSGCIVNTDKHRCYSKVMDDLDAAAHNAYSSEDHESLKPINDLHSHLRDFMRKFHGVSTKWLHLYLAYFKWIREYTGKLGEAVGHASNQMSVGDYIHRYVSISAMNLPFRDAQLVPIKTVC